MAARWDTYPLVVYAFVVASARWPDGHAPLRPHPLGHTLLAGSGLLLFWFWQMNDAALNADSGSGSGLWGSGCGHSGP